MKIVIVGAGISGLSVYHFLKRLLPPRPTRLSQHEVILYDSHDASRRNGDTGPSTEFSPVGGAVGIAPNGMRVLWNLDQRVAAAVTASGYQVSHFTLKNAYGWTLVRFGVRDPKKPSQKTVMCSRQAVWDCLREGVPDEAVIQKSIKEVSIDSNEGRPRLHFVNGSSIEADLIIGADGVKSIVKQAVTGDGTKDHYPPVYDGLVGIGGFIPSSYLNPENDLNCTTMTFSRHGFFGYGAVTSSPSSSVPAPSTSPPFGPQAVWWSTYSLPNPPPSTNPADIDQSSILTQLQSRHANHADPTIRRIIHHATQKKEITSIYPTYTTPTLPTWSKCTRTNSGSVVLIGDAAHALPTSSGQGVSQALEDAQALALFCSHYLSHYLEELYHHDDQQTPEAEAQAISIAVAQYTQLRKGRVERIARRARRAGDQKREKGLVEEWIMYFLIWVIGLWELYMGNSWSRWLYGYDVQEEVRKVVGA